MNTKPVADTWVCGSRYERYDRIPADGDGTIALVARACAMRGSV